MKTKLTCVLRYLLQVNFLIVNIFIKHFSLRELQRLDSMTRTPILSHFGETLSGLETIRAFGQQHRFTVAFFHKLDSHTNAFLIINSCNRWLGIALVPTWYFLFGLKMCWEINGKHETFDGRKIILQLKIIFQNFSFWNYI